MEEVGLYVYMVKGGVLTALALQYSSEIKICEIVCILLFPWKNQTSVSLFKHLKILLYM